MHRACVVNPVTSMAHFTGLLFSKGDRIQPLGLNKQVIVCRFSFVCVHVGAYMHAHTYASFSRQKCCCRRLPESGTLPIPAGFRMPKRNTGARTHAQGCARTPVDVSHDCPQIILIYKPGAFIF